MSEELESFTPSLEHEDDKNDELSSDALVMPEKTETIMPSQDNIEIKNEAIPSNESVTIDHEAEARFRQQKGILLSAKSEAEAYLDNETLDERDRVRLTRVIQLVERYNSDRPIVELEKVKKWWSFLSESFRFLPRVKKFKKTAKIENLTSNTYLLAEKTVGALRTLRHIDFKLEQEGGFSEDEIINQKRTTDAKTIETIETSLTLDYERKNWGVERICLDGLQNHLPSDAKGEHVIVRCLVGGKWISILEAKQGGEKIEAVRFADDGVGFDEKNLELLHSTKSEEKDSRGQFGEGLKMIAAAALREGLQPEMESLNWRARPIIKEESINDTRNQRELKTQRLCYQLEKFDGEPIIGSRTTFWDPSRDFLDELIQVEDKVLELRDNYRPIAVSDSGEIVDRNSGRIFVKDIYVCSKNTLFSYNFNDVETNRDRNAFASENIEPRIRNIVSELSNKNVAKTMLQMSILNPDAIESKLYDPQAKYPTVWLDAFYEAFGEDAVLDTGFQIPESLQSASMNKIKLPSSMTRLLLRGGVNTDKGVTPDFWEEKLSSGMGIDYGEGLWKEERILLDAVQNHLPRDSGGSYIGLRFKTKDNVWHQYKELPDIPNENISDVKIYDDGRGYDSRMLPLLTSGKKGNEDSAGKFGEGLKMICAASIRSGMNVTLQSREWLAKSRAEGQEIDGRHFETLVFDVVHSVKSDKNIDGDSIRQKSSTSFSNPTEAFLQEFRQIDKKVLAISNSSPIAQTNGGDLLAFGEGSLFIRELLIPGDHKLAYSYHFPRMDIKNRDRSFVEQDVIKSSIGNVWSEITSPELIKSFLTKATLEASSNSGSSSLEFQTVFKPNEPEVWKRNFQDLFGKNSSIRDVSSQDYDAFQQNQHVGLILVSFPSATYEVLSRLGLPTYVEVIQELRQNILPIRNENLTTEELKTIEELKLIDQYLDNNIPSDIVIYEKKDPNKLAPRGLSDGSSVYIDRIELPIFLNAADVYIHEKAHHNTRGEQDAASGYRDYLTKTLAVLATSVLKEARPDLVRDEV